ncbi:hypothetical protein TEA_011907 [Camellia sinensis var. sinensis]|uniref:Uncharacterized protein n=1 Tax=Camellia sinensis var. sinensis TaxID=542762 RepID=A0A4S4E7Y2_CAMSN|nr:hypothetical protein TEA_011907 [Camellia sinensis var. sinensis]
MATIIHRKISSDVAADTSLADTLSFAGFICIQDQSLNPENDHVLPLPPTKHDPEFEIGHSKGSLADLLFSNGQLLPQAIQSHSNQVVVHVSSKDLLPLTHGSSNVQSRRSSNSGLGFDKAAKKTNNVVRNNQGKKDQSKGNESLGLKIFKAVVAPCRSCRAVETAGPSSSMKVQASRQENAKLQ